MALVRCPKCGEMRQQQYKVAQLKEALAADKDVKAACIYCDHHWSLSKQEVETAIAHGEGLTQAEI